MKKLDCNNRPLTQHELNLLKVKCVNWSFSTELKDGFIPLGNGVDKQPTALLPHTMLMDNQISIIEEKHTIPHPKFK